MSKKRREGSYLPIALRRISQCFVAGDRNFLMHACGHRVTHDAVF